MLSTQEEVISVLVCPFKSDQCLIYTHKTTHPFRERAPGTTLHYCPFWAKMLRRLLETRRLWISVPFCQINLSSYISIKPKYNSYLNITTLKNEYTNSAKTTGKCLFDTCNPALCIFLLTNPLHVLNWINYSCETDVLITGPFSILRRNGSNYYIVLIYHETSITLDTGGKWFQMFETALYGR